MCIRNPEPANPAVSTLLVLPAVLSALTLAAHFLRNGHLVLTASGLAVALLLVVVRRPWVVRAAQTVLLLGTLEWSRSAGALLNERLTAGQPYTRMLVIMYGVAAFGAGSALLLNAAPVRRLYQFPLRAAREESPAGFPP